MQLSEKYTAWAVDAYHAGVETYGDEGATTFESEAVAKDIMLRDIAEGKVKIPTLSAEEFIDSVYGSAIRKERVRAKASFKKCRGSIVESLLFDGSDPAYDAIIPVGNGKDKRLGLWSPEDWATSVRTRYRNASDVTAEAREHDDQAHIIVEAMADRGVNLTEELTVRVSA